MRRRIASGLELDHIRRHLDELLDLVASGSAPASTWTPPVDVIEREAAFVVRVDVPGVDPGDIEVHMSAGDVRITGVKRQADPGAGQRRYHRMERGFGTFSLELHLPGPVDAARCTAHVRAGVIEVVLPRPAAAATAQRIPLHIEEP